MEGSNGGVTPDGVRAGDRAALQALVDRRGPAVVAFCTQVCGPQNADRAAAEAFARFRAAVRAAPDLGALNPELLLRGATRHAAASLARQPSGPPPHGKLRSRGTQTCEHVPTMLAARANGALGDADLDRLARHMERCERCDALGEIFRRAELAYQDPPVDTLGTDTSSVLMAALLAVPGDPSAVAPAPAADAAGPVETLTGAFPTLPDVDDEVPVAVAPPAAAAAPEPEAAPEPGPATAAHEPALVPDDEAYEPAEGDDDLGMTMEWDNDLPPLPDEDAPLEEVHEAEPEPGSVLTGGTKVRRSGPPRPLLVLLPLLLVVAIGLGAAAVAGVFTGDDATPAISKPPAPHVQAPVTTPLPIRVRQRARTTASTGTPASTTATGTAASRSGGTASSSTPSSTTP